MHVFLVPGFFGFANLGELTYFGHAKRALEEAFATLGVRASVHPARTLPAASLERRAARLAENLAARAGADDEPIHLVAHSAGGLDARLFVAPEVTLPTSVALEPLAARVRSIVAVSTPHAGTPLSGYFGALPSGRLLQLLSLVTIHTLKLGGTPISVLAAMASQVARLDGLLGVNSALLEQLADQLLSDFNQERRDAISRFLGEIEQDHSLIPQLTPTAMAGFNLRVWARPSVRAGCVVTMAPRPGLGSALATGMDPTAQAMHALYSALHRLVGTMPDSALPALAPEARDALVRAYGELPSASENDGIVPTRSQIFGTIIEAVRADHHDVIGHFNQPTHDPPHYDWLATGTSYRRGNFETTWMHIAEFLRDSSGG